MILVSVTEALEIRHVGLREYFSNYWNMVDTMALATLVAAAHALFLVYQAGAAYFKFNGRAIDLECRMPGARVCELYQTVHLLATMKYFMFTYGLFAGLHTLKALKYASLFPELDIPFQALMKVTRRLGTLTFIIYIYVCVCVCVHI